MTSPDWMRVAALEFIDEHGAMIAVAHANPEGRGFKCAAADEVMLRARHIRMLGSDGTVLVDAPMELPH